jgi:ADP-ribose pyrophosphatase YjhB (NUDIX family)
VSSSERIAIDNGSGHASPRGSQAGPRAPVVAVGVVLLDGDRVLVIRRGRPPGEGRWSVPGGKVQLGESLEAAGARELAEETGLEARLGPVVEVLDRVVRDAAGRIEHHFVIVDLLGTEPRGRLHAGSDARDARWVTLAELGDLPTTDGLEPVVRRAQAARAGALAPLRAREP